MLRFTWLALFLTPAPLWHLSFLIPKGAEPQKDLESGTWRLFVSVRRKTYRWEVSLQEWDVGAVAVLHIWKSGDLFSVSSLGGFFHDLLQMSCLRSVLSVKWVGILICHGRRWAWEGKGRGTWSNKLCHYCGNTWKSQSSLQPHAGRHYTNAQRETVKGLKSNCGKQKRRIERGRKIWRWCCCIGGVVELENVIYLLRLLVDNGIMQGR